jgi:methylated-DNA-protein-cysteine methyltransferase-like protein
MIGCQFEGLGASSWRLGVEGRSETGVRGEKSKKAKKVRTPAPTDTAARILEAVRRIPRGRVSTYGNIAQVAGLPRRARLVGTVLRQTPGTRDLPWHRVINAGGRISFPEGSESYLRQKRKLEAEGVEFRRGRVNLTRFGWPPRDLDALLWKLT